MNIGIACGGTGGHVYPGLATGRVLQTRGHRVTLWFSPNNIGQLFIGQWDGPVVYVGAKGLSSRPNLEWIGGLKKQYSAYKVSLRLLKETSPDVLLAMGSYTSVAPALASWKLGVPIVLHEGNVIPGRAISFLSYFAKSIGVAFEGASRYFPLKKINWTGFPMVHDFSLQFKDEYFPPEQFTLLVMGGSQGSSCLNEIVPEAVIRLYRSGYNLQVLHITGAQGESAVREKYEREGIKHMVFSFYREMGRLYNKANLAICRSGAATCMELSASGVPAVVIPLPSSIRDHQKRNALELQMQGGALMLPQEELTSENLSQLILNYMDFPEKLQFMGNAIKGVGCVDGAAKLADLVENSCARL